MVGSVSDKLPRSGPGIACANLGNLLLLAQATVCGIDVASSEDVALMANPNGVLVVDDEPAIARVTFWALAKAGFQPIVEENGAAGLKAFLAESNAIDLVLADVVMPVMDGITMVQEIRKVRPGIPVLFMTAYAHKAVTVKETKFPLINKPFFSEDLLRTVIEILDSPKEARGNSGD